MKSLRTHYYVMRYDGSKVYCGRSLDRAIALGPERTVIGQGLSEEEAQADAQRQIDFRNESIARYREERLCHTSASS